MTVSAALGTPAKPRQSVRRLGRWLFVDFAEPQTVLSWAIVGGGSRSARTVAWYEVEERDLRPPVDPQKFLRRRLVEAGSPRAVGLLTSRRLDAYVDVERAREAWSARCVATVGLGNAIRVGDPPGAAGRIGTINLLCSLSGALSEEALLEAMTVAAEARTAALIDAGIRSRVSGRRATGTGTDCIVVSAGRVGTPAKYAGKHTVIGHLVGAAVGEAIRSGAVAWKSEQRRAR